MCKIELAHFDPRVQKSIRMVQEYDPLDQNGWILTKIQKYVFTLGTNNADAWYKKVRKKTT